MSENWAKIYIIEIKSVSLFFADQGHEKKGVKIWAKTSLSY
jgi:hypothetical protein